MTKSVSSAAAALGRLGRAAMTPAQAKASAKNLDAARARRWLKKKSSRATHCAKADCATAEK